MADLYAQFGTDERAVSEGVELEYDDGNGDKTVIRITRAGSENKRYLKALEKSQKKYRTQIRNDTLGIEVQRRMMQEVFAETVVLGWENVRDREGSPLPFSKENCIRLFQDLPALWEDVFDQANSIAAFRQVIREERAKN